MLRFVKQLSILVGSTSYTYVFAVSTIVQFFRSYEYILNESKG